MFDIRIIVMSGECSDTEEYNGFSLYHANEAFNSAVENVLENNYQASYKYHVSISFEVFYDYFTSYEVDYDDYISIIGYDTLQHISENKMYLSEQYFNFIIRYALYKSKK